MFSPEQRSAIMSRIRSHGNLTTEVRFIGVLRRHKITGWRRGSAIMGRPDFVFRKARVAVFIDGDFWHGNPKKARVPKSNAEYWIRKIERNRARDRLVNRTLRATRWTVLRFWESDLRHEARVVARLTSALCSHGGA